MTGSPVFYLNCAVGPWRVKEVFSYCKDCGKTRRIRMHASAKLVPGNWHCGMGWLGDDDKLIYGCGGDVDNDGDAGIEGAAALCLGASSVWHCGRFFLVCC